MSTRAGHVQTKFLSTVSERPQSKLRVTPRRSARRLGYVDRSDFEDLAAL